MAVITNIVATIQMRSDTYTEWYNKNPVLASGEIAYNKTDGTIKIGDGATTWRLLPSSVLTTRTIAGKNLSSNITAESLKTALALGAVNNTSDVEKPVSTAQGLAINQAKTDSMNYTDSGVAGIYTYLGETYETKNPYSLTVKQDGVTLDTYDGSSAKTINITSGSGGGGSGNLPIIYGYSDTALEETTKVVSATSSSNPFTEYIKDQIYVIEFYYGNTALNPTININSAGAKTVRRLGTNGGTITNSGIVFYNQNSCIAAFVYDGTYMIPISCFSRYINASETRMSGYSKAGAISAIKTSDTVLSAIGKLEKAVDSAGGGGSGGTKQWVHFGTAPHSDGGMRFYPEDISEVFIIYSNRDNGQYDSLTEVAFGPVSVVNDMTLPEFTRSRISCRTDYIEVEWDPTVASDAKNYVTVYGR